jgi:hypothetical protein
MEAKARAMAGFFVMTRENSTLPRRQARTTARLPYAESPRTRIFPVAPVARAVCWPPLSVQTTALLKVQTSGM